LHWEHNDQSIADHPTIAADRMSQDRCTNPLALVHLDFPYLLPSVSKSHMAQSWVRQMLIEFDEFVESVAYLCE